MPTIELVDVNRYYGPVHVCKGINLAVADGEFVSLLGSSGCGKTTTLNLIAGLDDPSSGDILMNGQRVNDLEPVDRDVAMVFQNYALYPHMTVAGNLGFNLKLKGMSAVEINERISGVAESLDLRHLLDRYPSQLSGGQQQRVAIGRAIIRRPRVFLFDEPFSNLDAALRNRMRAEVKALHRRLGVTSIFVTHDQEEAMSISDRIAVMRNGVVEQYGSPEQVYAQPANTFIARFVGSPQIELMTGSIVAMDGAPGVQVSDRTFPLDGSRAGIAVGTAVDVGVRPEHVFIRDGGIPATVETVQPVGPSTHVRLKWAGGTIIASVPGFMHVGIGATAPFGFDPSHLLIFDQKSGTRL
jgi:ABC-type sugar transport system ATPase subunit